ncbi:TP0733 family outer membrane beta-barrel protein [Salinispira pacifica]
MKSHHPVYRSLLIFCIMLIAALPLSAQDLPEGEPEEERVEITRVLGDQYLTIGLGTPIPLFIYDPPGSDGESAVKPMNLKVGMAGGLGWSAFVNNNMSLGLEVNASYNADPNGEGFFIVPMGLQTNYFLRAFPFEIPLHFGSGLTISRYKDLTTFSFMLKGGAAMYWNATEDWSFGLNLNYWWLPEIYRDNGSGAPASMTRFGNFLEVTIRAMYNF